MDATDSFVALESYCSRNGIEAEFIETNGSAESAEDAAQQLNTSVSNIIKSLVFLVDREYGDESEPVLVVSRGCDAVNPARVAAIMEAESCELADPDTVEAATGYGVGAVPPVSTDLQKVVDERVLEQDYVYGGGGATDRVIGMDPRFIVAERDLVDDVVR